VPNELESLLWVMVEPTVALDEGFIENAARKSHSAYVQSKTKDLWNTAPNMMEWGRLADTYKKANINQVVYSAELFARNGFKIVKDPKGALSYSSLMPAEQLALAKAEHGRWVSDRVKGGWAPGKRDDSKKRHNCIALWDDLTEEIKGYDYQAIENLFKSYAEGGYYIVRA